MADKQFNLDFYAKVETDLSSIKGVVSELKRQLSSLEIPKSASKGFERSLESLNAELQNFEAIATRGVASLSDTKKMNASWRKISTIFSSLGIQIKDLGDIDFFPKEVTSNIEKANKALASYQNKVEEIKKSQTYKDKVSAKGQAEASRQSVAADWQREKKKLESMERASTANRTAWNQNRSKEYAEQTQKLAELNSQIEQQNKALAEQRAIQQQLHSMKVVTKDGQIRESHSAALNKAKAKQEELKAAKAAAQEQEKLAKEQEKAAKKVLSSAKGQETKARKKSGDDKDPKVVAAIEARTRAEQAYAAAKAKSTEATQNLAKIEKDSLAAKTRVDELESQQEAAKATATQIEEIEAQKRALESSRDAVKKAAKENESFKASLDASDTALQDQRTKVETYRTAMDTAEQAVENFNNELKQMELSGAASEWTQLTEIVRNFTGIDLSGFQGDVTRIIQVLNDYKNGQIKDTPELIKKLKEAAGAAAPAMQHLEEETAGARRELEEMSRAEREMENLKNQILEFFSVSNAIQIFKNAVRDAFDTVKELDAAMTETAVVTDFSIGDMWEKLPEYSAQATQLGTSIKSLYEATTLYYQQGLDTQQAMGVGIETMKMARIANMDAAAATEAMTAALRGFNMEINELSATRINDVYSELAAITASDTEQIATAMSKTASIAASANMEFETTAALLAQIIETTQEAPETAGTAVKTIIARFSEVKKLKEKGLFSGEDSEGELIDVNKIQAALRTVGISMDEFFAGTRGLDSILLELASKWNTLDFETQHYIATMAAGSRQQSRFMAMMSNYERTMELVAAANNSAGASQKQFDKTLESLDAKLQRLQNAWDTFVMGLVNNELIKTGVDLLTKLLETINNLTDDLGGVIGGIAKLGVAVAALKTGKSIFDKIFDVKPLEWNVGKINSLSSLVGNGINRLSKATENGLSSSIKKATMSIQGFSTALTLGGVACGAFAQYLRSMGLDDAAKGFEILGGVLIAVGTGFSFVASTAAAAGISVSALFTKLGAILASILPWILAIGAAIAVVAVVLKKIYDNSAAGKLKAAQKATKAAAEAAAEAAEEYSNLNTAISSITDKTNSLSELTKGTQEWRDAVVSLNSEILSLVESYPELASFLTNEDGVLKIDYEKTATNKYGKEQTANDILESYLRKQTETQQIHNKKQIDEKQAEIDLEYSKTMRDFANSLSFIDKEKAEKEGETGSAWARKIVEKLSIEIAKGNLQTDETSIQKWLDEQNVQTKDFEEFDYSVFKTYGDYLLSQQTAIDGLTDATIAAQMAMMKLTNVSTEASDAVLNFDDNILREAYNRQLNEAKTRELTEEDRRAYAEFMGYSVNQEYTRNARGRSKSRKVTVYRDENGEKVNLNEGDVREFVVNRATNEDFTGVLQKIAERFDSSDDTQRELFTEVFANGIQELSLDTLSRYGTYKNQEFSFSEDASVRDAFAEALNFDSFQEMADVFELAPEQLAEQIEQIFTEGGAEFVKVRKNLVKNMTKFSTGAQKDFDVNANLLNLLEAKYKDLDVSGILSDVISKLELTGDEEFSTAAYESLRNIMMKAKGAVEMEDALNFFNEIDFSNPIDALDTINNEIKNGTGYSSELARAMKRANSSFLSTSSQMSALFNSTDFEDIKEDLDDIIEKNGEISASDVFDLTKSYKSLDKVLKNNKMTANGLAEILEQIAEGTVKVDELTDTVLAAMSSFESLDSIAAKTVKFFENFDLGIDESIVGDTIVEWGDLILENMKKGAVGNSQNFRILDTLFPGWDEDIETAEARVAEMTRLGELLKGNGQNLRKMWSDIHAGKDYKGNDISLSKENQKMGLSVRDTGEEIIFEGWEGKDLTSADLVSWISDAYEVSTEMAEAMLTDFKNYSGDLAEELKTNDYVAGIEEAYEALHKFGNLKLVDEREIQTIAKLLGVDAGTVRNDLKEHGATITNFYDNKGEIKSFEEIQGFMDTQKAGLEAGKKWSDGFMSSFEVGGLQGGKIVETLNLSDLEKELNKIGITGLNAEKLKEQAFYAMKEGLGSGAQAGVAQVTEILANGDEVTVTITPEMSYEEYQQQVTKLTQQAENNALADAIGSSVAEAMSNIEVTAAISENSLIQFRTKIEETASQAQPEANVTLSEDSANTMRGNITEIAEEPHTSPVTISINNPNAINSLMGRKTVYVDIIVDKNEVPSATNNTTGGLPGRAKGIKDAPHAETSLVSEEGPELIQKANGSAYLSGTSGPEIVDIEKGDTVYTAEETENIFKKRSHNEFPRYASGYGNGTAYWGSGSGGKGSGDSDDEDWENPFDKLYNLVREIDEELRRRERLERRYEKLLESVDLTAGKLFDNAVEQLKQLEKEKLLNKELQEVRRSQIQQYQQENADLMKYAKVVQNERGEDVLRIHWDQINLVEDPEQGQRIEDYASQLEEWFDSLEEAEDKLNDIEDRIEEVKELGKEEYLDLENAVKDALTASYQAEIDKLSEINESINDSNTELIDAMTRQISRIRQQRENENTERELEEKQRRILYLSQDTSGANDLEILNLQKELDQESMDYTDTLIDQKIEELQMQNEDAAKQREQQLQVMQTQLDYLIESGQIWDQVETLLEEGLDEEVGLIRGSKLEEILKDSENFSGMSKLQQMEWLKELEQQAAQAVTYMRLTTEKIDTAVELNRQNYFGETTPEPEYNGSSSGGSGGSSGGSGGGGSSGGGSGFNNSGYDIATVRKAQQFVGTAVDDMWGANSQAAARAKGYNSLAEVIAAMNGSGNSGDNSGNNNSSNNENYSKVQVGFYTKTGELKKTVTYDKNSDWESLASYWAGVYGGEYGYYTVLKKYKTGGLADFTGPAWLDGTKSRPELVLNQKDTQNFIQLKDILASLMAGSHTSTENNGDTIYDIDINVESIGNDYDVEQVANKVKSLINSDAHYRNNNVVGLKR